jgi:hypothetical protein
MHRLFSTRARAFLTTASIAVAAAGLGLGVSTLYGMAAGGPCCFPGSPCCYPGSPCCAHAHAAAQPPSP